MESVEATLCYLDNILAARIESLEETNRRMRRTIGALKKYHKMCSIIADTEIKLMQNAPKSAEPFHTAPNRKAQQRAIRTDSKNDEATISRSTLDDILSMAKDLRVSADHRGGKRATPEAPGVTKSRGSANPSITNTIDDAKDQTVRSPEVNKSDILANMQSDKRSSVVAVKNGAHYPSSMDSPSVPSERSIGSQYSESLIAAKQQVAEIDHFLDTLSKRRISHHGTLAINAENKETYRSSARLLSGMKGRPCHPTSLPFRVLCSTRDPVPIGSSNRPSLAPSAHLNASSAESEVGNIDDYASKICRSLQGVIHQYNTKLKLRLSQLSLSQMTAQDRDEVMYMWLKSRKLIDLYEHYTYHKHADSRSRSRWCSCLRCLNSWNANIRNNPDAEGVDMAKHIVDELPLRSPIDPPTESMLVDGTSTYSNSSNGTTSVSRMSGEHSPRSRRSDPDIRSRNSQQDAWLSDARQRVSEFHDVFESRVKFTAERSMGKILIKEAIKKLRTNSEKQSAQTEHYTHTLIHSKKSSSIQMPSLAGHSGRESGHARESNGSDGIVEWKDGLQFYRSVVSLLCDEVRTQSNCVFLER